MNGAHCSSLAMEALCRNEASHSLSRIIAAAASASFKRHFQLDPPPPPPPVQTPLKPLPYFRMNLHPDWKQVDNKVRRMESRLADFRILSNDLRIQKGRLDSADPSVNKETLSVAVNKREEEVATERTAIHAELQKFTTDFCTGAQREYVALRKFFMVYLYITTRTAFESLKHDEFENFLKESPEGVTYELPNRGTISFSHHLCTKVAYGQRLYVPGGGVYTSPVAIAMAILQAAPEKHCDDPYCKKDDCHVLKADYEELFEAFFKRKVRIMINQKVRGEMPSEFDEMMKIEKNTQAEVK